MIPIETIDGILEYLKGCERTARRARRRTTQMLAVVAVGAISSVAFTIRDIAQGDPWWLITLDVLIIAAWAFPGTAYTRELRDNRKFAAEIYEARAKLYQSRLFDVWMTGPAAPSIIQDEDPTTTTPTT